MISFITTFAIYHSSLPLHAPIPKTTDSTFSNLSTKITTKREFRLSSAEGKHLAIPLSESY